MKWKPLESINQLQPGEIVRNKTTKHPYNITANYGDRATGVSTCDVTNTIEWEILQKEHNHKLK